MQSKVTMSWLQITLYQLHTITVTIHGWFCITVLNIHPMQLPFM